MLAAYLQRFNWAQVWHEIYTRRPRGNHMTFTWSKA